MVAKRSTKTAKSATKSPAKKSTKSPAKKSATKSSAKKSAKKSATAKKSVTKSSAAGPSSASDLAWAIEAWQRTHDPRVADLVDLLGALESPAPLKRSGRAADLAAWNEAEARHDPADFGALVAAAGGGTRDNVIEQAKKLSAWKDPRFGAGMLKLIEDPPYVGSKARMMVRAIATEMIAHGDGRLAVGCRELAGRYLAIIKGSVGGFVVEQLERVAAAADAVIVEALPAADEKRLAALEAKHRDALAQLAERRNASADAKQSLETLLAAVYAAPDDDGPRIVFADALLELGDDRGEFIHLQLARARGAQTPEQAAREKQIAEARGPSLAQPLANAGSCELERGFPEEIVLYKTAKKLLGDPAWATIRSIGALADVAENDAIALLDHPTTAGVRRVATLGPELATAVTRRERPWTHVSLEECERLSPAVLRALPELRFVDLDFDGPPPSDVLAELAAAKHVEELRIHIEGQNPVELPLPATLRELDIHTSSAVRIVTALDQLEEAKISANTLPAHAFASARKLRWLALELRFGRLDDDALAGLDELETLALQVKESRPRSLAGLPKLRKLVLRHDDSAPVANGFFTHLGGLTDLDLQWTRTFNPYHLAALEHLETLSSHCLGVDLLPSLPALRRARVREPDNFDLAPVFERVPALQHLELSIERGPLEVRRIGAQDDVDAWPRFAAELAASRVSEITFNEVVTLSRDAEGKLTQLRINMQHPDLSRMLENICRGFGLPMPAR